MNDQEQASLCIKPYGCVPEFAGNARVHQSIERVEEEGYRFIESDAVLDGVGR